MDNLISKLDSQIELLEDDIKVWRNEVEVLKDIIKTLEHDVEFWKNKSRGKQ